MTPEMTVIMVLGGFVLGGPVGRLIYSIFALRASTGRLRVPEDEWDESAPIPELDFFGQYPSRSKFLDQQ